MNLITILAVLFLSLFGLIFLLERFGPNMPNQTVMKLSKFIFPLLGVILLVQAIRYFVA